jgi:hypothetical protein
MQPTCFPSSVKRRRPVRARCRRLRALCNAIEESQVTADSLSQAIGFIPHELRVTYVTEVAALESLHQVLGHHQGISEGSGGGARMAWDQGDSSTN